MGYLTGKAKGVDVRLHGSGNIGMTNVMRVLGVGPGLLVLVADAGKGVAAVWIGHIFGGVDFALLCGLSAIAGHNWSVFLRFQGGRGVATSAGVILALSPAALLSAVALWVVIVAVTRYVSLASMIAAVSVPAWMLLYRQPQTYVLLGLVGAALIIYRHLPNIERLLQGTEAKWGRKR